MAGKKEKAGIYKKGEGKEKTGLAGHARVSQGTMTTKQIPRTCGSHSGFWQVLFGRRKTFF